MQHETGDKGDIGVAKAISDLIEKGYVVLSPIASTTPFDLVAYKNGEFHKIQVKYRHVYKGKIEAHFRRAIIVGTKASYRAMSNEECDVMCIYCPETDKCYYVKRKNFESSVALRVGGSRQTKNVNFAQDFEKF